MRSYDLIKGNLKLDTKPRAIFVCGDICSWCLPSVFSGLATLISKSCSYCCCLLNPRWKPVGIFQQLSDVNRPGTVSWDCKPRSAQFSLKTYWKWSPTEISHWTEVQSFVRPKYGQTDRDTEGNINTFLQWETLEENNKGMSSSLWVEFAIGCKVGQHLGNQTVFTFS